LPGLFLPLCQIRSTHGNDFAPVGINDFDASESRLTSSLNRGVSSKNDALFVNDDRPGRSYFLQRIGNHGDVARRVFAGVLRVRF
jgi:hypothetical protein